MATATDGTFEELAALAEPEVRELLTAARGLVLEEHPDATEVVRLGDRAATYGFGPKKMSEGHTYVMPHRAHVNVGFYYGADLLDPDRLLEGTGARMRHVKVRTLEELEACRGLIRAAIEERRAALGL